MTIIDEIIAERLRQQHEDGFDAAHDDENVDGEMARAAATYALHCDIGGLTIAARADLGTTAALSMPRCRVLLSDIYNIPIAATVTSLRRSRGPGTRPRSFARHRATVIQPESHTAATLRRSTVTSVSACAPRAIPSRCRGTLTLQRNAETQRRDGFCGLAGKWGAT